MHRFFQNDKLNVDYISKNIKLLINNKDFNFPIFAPIILQ